LFSKLGAHVTFCGPQTMLPRNIDAIAPGTNVARRIEEAVDGADVVMMLRIQNERMEGSMFPGTREYSRTFGLNFARLALAKPDVIVMHPGPVNRGVEIDPRIADGDHSVILDQVEAGVAVRSAVLALVMGKA
jgi:aspartate carbamoyltransferase catalytic subunit